MDVLIELKALTKNFDTRKVSHQVLKGINLTVNRGDFMSIKGPSGCGKSTLLSILGLLDTATTGDYILCGTHTNTLDFSQLSHLRNNNIGWIFQNFNLINDMTVEQNILLPLKYCKDYSKAQKQQMVEDTLNKVNMTGKNSFYPNELSGGQQQRVAIARALINDPDLILADEPTGNLDSENAKLIFELLVELNSAGKTILIVTHADDIAAQCQMQLNMLDGQFIQKAVVEQ